ncbi:MAG: hypothetical protein Q7T30_03215 [Planctomycetota bacterium]|nr:hypothetical protein [Planctomycetota bacterium]
MKAWKLLLPVPFLIALAFVPQGQNPPDTAIGDLVLNTSISELNYINLQGVPTSVSARNVVEIRVIEDVAHAIRLELFYENGDYSLIDASAFHLLRTGGSTREVKLVRGKQARMRFPKGLIGG